MAAQYTSDAHVARRELKTLVVYFSLTGTTEVVARELAASLDATIEQLVDSRIVTGLPGYLRLAHDHLRRNVKSHLLPVANDPGDFDLVVLGGPIWSSKMCAPATAYAVEHRDRLSKVALFCTARSGKPGYAEACMNAMARETGLSPLASLGLSQREVRQEHAQALDEFVSALRIALP